MLDLLKSKGIQYEAYDTTCPFVELVWKRSKQLSSKAATVIIHGKPNHEETKATFSNAISSGKAIVIKDMAEARLLGGFILNQCTEQELLAILGDRFSTELDIFRDFEKVGVVNQTTMLAEETQAIADYFKHVMIEKYGEQELSNHFEDTRDTLCYATNDNQQAMKELINESGDFALVIGGHNSSNTTHLVELAAEKLPTYFILNEDSIHPDGSITHFDLHSKKYVTANQVIQSAKSHEILISAGASCPDRTVENVLVKLLRVQGIEPDKLVRSISALT
jgi:4-hydroxy-3-methylbut-2-enyl diphosphate reductase